MRLLPLALMSLALPEGVQALSLDEAVTKTRLSGFLSVRGGQLRDDDIAYLNTLDDEMSFSEESVFGLQADTTLNDDVSVSLQMKNDNGNGRVEMEWAYAEYAFASDLKARVGRLRAPGFMLSEFLDVGYAYPWVNVPEEVYGWLPFSRYEGVDLRYWKSVGPLDLRITPYGGSTSGQKLILGNAEYTDQSSQFGGIDLQASYDIFTVRAGYSRYNFTLSNSSWDRFVNGAIDGTVISPYAGPAYPEIRRPGFIDFVEDVLGAVQRTQGDDVLSIAQTVFGADPALVAAERQSLEDQLGPYRQVPGMDGSYSGEFSGVGFSLDDGTLMVMSELSRSSIGGVYPDVDSGYFMVGRRFGTLMPHFTVAKMYTTDDGERPDLRPLDFNPDIWNLNGVLMQAVDGANTYTDVLISVSELVRLEQERYTLGLRWDASENLAIKAEVFQVRLKNGSYGFALPSSITQLADSGGAQTATDVEIPPPPEHISGMKLSLDMVF
jgi:hypothetical protein